MIEITVTAQLDGFFRVKGWKDGRLFFLCWADTEDEANEVEEAMRRISNGQSPSQWGDT